jgi:biopolymer transport protein ExbB
MVDILTRGGFMMIPILLGSVLSLAIIIERFWSLQKNKVFPSPFLDRMNSMLQENKESEALSACRENDTPIARILAAGLENAKRSRSVISEALELSGRQEHAYLSKGIGALGAVASLEPLMGLLGTVLGLIESFQKVEQLKVVGNPSVVASGVWQALITTAAGLMIAIPAFIMYRVFRGKVSSLIMGMESIAFGLVQELTEEKPAGEEK